MAYSYIQYTGNGVTTNFSVTFPFISRDHVAVTKDGVSQSFTWINDSTIQLSPAPANGTVIDIRRSSSRGTKLVDFEDASILTEAQLDLAATQSFYMSQEGFDIADGTIALSSGGGFDAAGKRIVNVMDPGAAQDAVTKAYGDANYGGASATNAAASAAAAAASAAAAAVSASSASGSATSASGSAVAAAAALTAFLVSPAFTGVPTAPTAAPGTNNTQIATTAYADAIVAAKADIDSPVLTGNPRAPTPSTADDDTSIATTAFVQAQKASPAFTGTPTAPTATGGNSTTQIATTAFVQGELTAKAPLASPAFTGNPTAPTPSGGDNDTSIATTAFVQGELAAKAPLASPAFTGNPTAPTASPGDNDTSIATTAFVAAAVAAVSSSGTVDNCQGRLSLSSGVALTTSDVTAATTLYWVPFNGNKIDLYNGSTWTTYSSGQMSIAVPATTNTMYDVFVYNNAGTPELELTAWSSGTARATALTTVDGVLVKSGSASRRYLGSFSTTSVSGQTEDSKHFRYLSNYYNPRPRPMKRIESTDTWNNNAGTLGQANGNSANQLNFVIGISEYEVRCAVLSSAYHSSAASTAAVSIGLDSTTVGSSDVMAPSAIDQLASRLLQANYAGFPGIGRHYLAWLEFASASGTTTFNGDGGLPTALQSGITGTIWG